MLFSLPPSPPGHPWWVQRTKTSWQTSRPIARAVQFGSSISSPTTLGSRILLFAPMVRPTASSTTIPLLTQNLRRSNPCHRSDFTGSLPHRSYQLSTSPRPPLRQPPQPIWHCRARARYLLRRRRKLLSADKYQHSRLLRCVSCRLFQAACACPTHGALSQGYASEWNGDFERCHWPLTNRRRRSRSGLPS